MIDYIICENSWFVVSELVVGYGGQDMLCKITILERIITHCILFYSHE